MPKMKTRRGARDRFSVTATGKILRQHSYASHLNAKKSRKRKRHLHQRTLVDKVDVRRVRRMLGI